ncbi:hypothetical protein BJ875DRAFT_497845 [Amylocarpus encephaloides]|uniref:C2H2-type domain-containing protein n=1 Tax=Amylocarpus encephaloides TaxID=45428 RepID=A0A9P7YE69_9HELO|nr:hypothetical protein BJ875DRAFT_497845 [Amylocarpus encephaloides]
MSGANGNMTGLEYLSEDTSIDPVLDIWLQSPFSAAEPSIYTNTAASLNVPSLPALPTHQDNALINLTDWDQDWSQLPGSRGDSDGQQNPGKPYTETCVAWTPEEFLFSNDDVYMDFSLTSDIDCLSDASSGMIGPVGNMPYHNTTINQSNIPLALSKNPITLNPSHGRCDHHYINQCAICSISFPTKAALHVHTKETEHTPYSCICGKLFSRIDVLDRHIHSSHSLAASYPCPHCKKHRGSQAFRRRDHLTQHLKGYHNMDLSLASDSDESLDNQPSQESSTTRKKRTPKSLFCPNDACCKGNSDLGVLRIAYQTQSQLTQHIREVHDESLFPCQEPRCSRTSTSHSSLLDTTPGGNARDQYVAEVASLHRISTQLHRYSKAKSWAESQDNNSLALSLHDSQPHLAMIESPIISSAKPNPDLERIQSNALSLVSLEEFGGRCHFPMEPFTITANPWEIAKERYLSMLEPEEKTIFNEATIENLYYKTSNVEREGRKHSKTRLVASTIHPLIEKIGEYCKAMDVYASVAPIIIAPIWGSIRVVLGRRHSSKTGGLSSDLLRRKHPRLNEALVVTYLDIIEICLELKTVITAQQKNPLKRMVQSSSSDLDRKFKDVEARFRVHRKTVDREADVCHMIEAAESMEVVKRDRHLQELNDKDSPHNQFQLKRNLMQQLCVINPAQKHKKVRSTKHESTGAWLFRRSEWGSWLRSEASTVLCCHGIPGCGKTVLASSVIDSLAANSGPKTSMTAYYFCDYADKRTLDPIAILGGLVRTYAKDDIPEEIVGLVRKYYQDGERLPSVKDVLEILRASTLLHTTTNIVIDGIDEVDEENRIVLLQSIARLISLPGSCMKVVMMCREDVGKPIKPTPV